MERFVLPKRVKRKAIKDDVGRIVGHEFKREPYLPDGLKKTHELRSYKDDSDPSGEKKGEKNVKVAVRMSVEDRNHRRLHREKGAYKPDEGTYYDIKHKLAGLKPRGSSNTQKGVSRGENEQGMAHLIGRQRKNKVDDLYNQRKSNNI